MKTILLIIFLFTQLFLTSCSHHMVEKTNLKEGVHQFGINHYTNGVHIVNYDTKFYQKLKSSKILHSDNAKKHVPLNIITKEYDLLVFGTKDQQIKAIDLKTNKLVWSFKYHLDLNSTPLYDDKNKIIYALMSNKEDDRQFHLLAINLHGKIISKKEIDILKLYQKNNPKLSPVDMITIFSRTALGINKFNKKPYIYFAFTNSKGAGLGVPWGKKEKYGELKGASGLVVGYYLEKNGHFSRQSPLMFFTNKLTDEKYSGMNSGIYLSGSALTLLDDNTLIVATANGYTEPSNGKFGCSIIKINGEDFKLAAKNSYYTNDKSKFQECYVNMLEFSSAHPAAIKHENKFHYWLMDKSSNIHFLSEIKQTNKYYRALSKNKIDLETEAYPIYSGGNILIDDNEIHIITKVNNHQEKSYSNEIIATDKIKGIDLKNYIKKKCIGAINKEGSESDRLSIFYSGPHIENSIIGNKNKINYVTRPQISQNPKLNKIKSRFVHDWFTPLIEIQPIGHNANKDQTPIKYKFKEIPLSLLYRKRGKIFYKFYNNYFKTNLSTKLKSIILESNNFQAYINDKDDTECSSLDVNKYEKLFIFSKKIRKLKKGFILRDFVIRDNKLDKVWELYSPYNDIIFKNSLITLVHPKKNSRITLFSAINSDNGQSYFYIVDSINGKILARKPFSGSMHFSHLIYTRNGIVIPTRDKGLNYFKFL